MWYHFHHGMPASMIRPTPPVAAICFKIGDHLPRRLLHFVSQTVGESIIVAVVMKDCPPAITARADVVNRTGELQTRRSRHHAGPSIEGEHTNAKFLIDQSNG